MSSGVMTRVWAGMSPGERRGWRLAVGLHGAVFLAWLVMLIWPDLSREEEVVVLELVSLSAEVPSVSPRPSPTPPPVEEEPLRLPELEPTPQIPEAVELPPEPVVEPPAPQPEPVQRMTREEFVRQFGNPEPTPARPRPRPVVRPQLDVSDMQAELRRSLTDSSERARMEAMDAGAQEALLRYTRLVKARLDAAFARPVGLRQDLRAVARFRLDAAGGLTGLRLSPGSGSDVFDAAVRAAFSRAAPFPASPDGQGYDLVVTFRMAE